MDKLGTVARLQLLPGQDNTAALAQVRGEARPSLILLDNLQHAPQLEPLLQELAGDPALPHIVATLVQQAGVQHTELQLRCSFRWVLVAAHMEPARGYLGRALRARLLQHEVETRCKILQVGRICFVMSIPFAGPYLGKDYGH